MEKITVKNTGKYRVIVFTGAGISKDSGILTFDETISKAEPNAVHHAIAKYGLPVITMNIDKLHKMAAIDPNQTIVAVHRELPD